LKLGTYGRNRTNVWDYPGVNSRRDELALHPPVKPVALVARRHPRLLHNVAELSSTFRRERQRH